MQAEKGAAALLLARTHKEAVQHMGCTLPCMQLTLAFAQQLHCHGCHACRL